MKGGPVAAQLASEIQVIIPTTSGIENRYLEGWDEFGNTSTNGGVAAQSTTLQITNPATSNVVAVFEKLNVATSVADQVFLRKGLAAANLTLVNVGIVMREDPRGRQASSLVFSINDAGHAPALVQAYAAVSTSPTLFGEFVRTDFQEIPLFPGDMIQLSAGTVGVETLTWVLRWRERFLEDSERA
jgi:hypothetical protein